MRTKSGDMLSGRKTEDTDDHVTILDSDGKYHDVPAAQVDRKEACRLHHAGRDQPKPFHNKNW